MLFDSLAMKAWLPRQWFTENDIFLVLDHLQSGVLGSAAYFLLQGNYLGSSNIGAQFQYLSLLYLAIIIVSRGFKSKKTIFAVLLAYLFITIPGNLWQVSGAYDDIWLTLLATSGILTITSYSKLGKNSERLIPLISGTIGASLFLGKLSLLPYVIVALVSPMLFPSISLSVRKVRNILFAFVVFLIAISVPILWRWYSYGNPIWPLYNGIFRAKSLPPTNEHFNLPMGPLELKELILAPITSFFHPENWVEGGSIGLFSFTLASAYLGVTFLLRKKYNYEIFIVGLTSLVFLINWWASFRYLRYTLTIAPLVLIVLISSNYQIHRYIGNAKLIGALLLVSIPALIAIPTGNPASPDRIPFKVIMGLETPDEYRLRGMPAVTVINWLNANALPNAKISSSGSVFYQRLLLREDLDIYYDWELNPQNSKDIDYVLIYKPIKSAILDNLIDNKCIVKSFENEFYLYGGCK
jgi:hypothetical protein